MPNKAKSEREIAEFRKKVSVAATELFTERGVANVTMRQIADKVGVSAMTPYRYFRDKDEILAMVRADAFTKFATALEKAAKSESDARLRARAVGDAYVKFARKSPAAYHLMFDFVRADSSRYPELVAADQRARHTMTDYVKGMIGEGLIKGDADTLGYMFWAALHGIVMLDMAGALKDSVGADALRSLMFQTLYQGLVAGAPPELPDKPPLLTRPRP